MKKWILLIALLILIPFIVGCTTSDARLKHNAELQNAYFGQKRTSKTMYATFHDGGSITFANVKTFTVENQLPTLGQPQREPGPGEIAADITKSALGVAPWVAGAVVGSKLADTRTVTQQEAVIVDREVPVFVGSPITETPIYDIPAP